MNMSISGGFPTSFSQIIDRWDSSATYPPFCMTHSCNIYVAHLLNELNPGPTKRAPET